MNVPHVPAWLRILSVIAGVAVWILALLLVGEIPVIREILAATGVLLVMGGIFGGPLT